MEKPAIPDVITYEILFGPKGAVSKSDHNDWKLITFIFQMDKVIHRHSVKKEFVSKKKRLDEKMTMMMTMKMTEMSEFNEIKKAMTPLALKKK